VKRERAARHPCRLAIVAWTLVALLVTTMVEGQQTAVSAVCETRYQAMMENQTEFPGVADRLRYWQGLDGVCGAAAIYHLRLGGLLSEVGQLAEAKVAFEAGLARNNGSEKELTFGLADMLFRLGKLDESHALAEDLLADYADWYGGYSALGQIQLARGQYADGVKTLERATEFGADTAVYQLLALGYYALDRPRDVATAMQAALRLDRNAALSNTPAVCATAYALLALGFPREADDLLWRHIEVKPSASGNETFVAASAAVKDEVARLQQPPR
jgi:tetratricopeptide (TPR) repeat protein